MSLYDIHSASTENTFAESFGARRVVGSERTDTSEFFFQIFLEWNKFVERGVKLCFAPQAGWRSVISVRQYGYPVEQRSDATLHILGRCKNHIQVVPKKK